MKHSSPFTLMVAALSFAFVQPHVARAMSAAQESASSSTANSSNPAGSDRSASGEVREMVPAQAELAKNLDSKKAQAGQEFEATLKGKVHLKDGTELPSGTKLVGTIATDNSHAGSATLALRFTKAELKDGKAIPIKAMIVGVNPPPDGPPYDVTAGTTNTWDYDAQQVDDVGVMRDIDLHSRANGDNSGVFVSTKNKDIRLGARYQLALAIAPQGNA